jgi:hypothetical protein
LARTSLPRIPQSARMIGIAAICSKAARPVIRPVSISTSPLRNSRKLRLDLRPPPDHQAALLPGALRSQRSVSRPLLVSFAARMRAQSPRLEQRSKRLRLPVRSRRKRGITGFTGTAIASVIGSLSSVPMSAGTIGFRARQPRTDRARLMRTIQIRLRPRRNHGPPIAGAPVIAICEFTDSLGAATTPPVISMACSRLISAWYEPPPDGFSIRFSIGDGGKYVSDAIVMADCGDTS